ncbi:hypothetical protein [Reticulibacter mediterranei]|nr:hypothetical protein [Reticulibacter mediterranei]
MEAGRYQVATEDVAMTVGAEFESSILFDRYRITPTITDLQFYMQQGLFAIPEQLLATSNLS